MTAPPLRQYQHTALDAVADALATGLNRQLVQMATGLGKTEMFSAMLLHDRLGAFIRQHAGRGASMLVIAHREELLDQAREKIMRRNPGLVVDIEQGPRTASRAADVIIASIQTLAAGKCRRLKKLLQTNRFPLVVIDEAHHAPAPSYRTVLVHLGFLPPADATDEEGIEAIEFDDVAVMEAALKDWDTVAPKDRLLVGVTATPNRTDAIGLGCVFQAISYTYGIKRGIEDHYLVPIQPFVIESDVSLDNVRTTAGEFNQKDLAAAVNLQVRNELAVASWRELAFGRPTLAFTVDVAHAHAMAKAFRDAGVRAEAISGETPRGDGPDQRAGILRRYREGDIEVLTNCMVLTEGTDLPLTSCILHAKPTKSATLYEQMTGRGLRLWQGKDDCLVIDIVDIARKHSLQTAPVLYGLPPGLQPEEHLTLDEMERELARLAAEFPHFDIEAALREGRLTLADLRARATQFDVWTVQALRPDLRSISKLDWMTLPSGLRLQYPWTTGDVEGLETIDIRKDLLGHYELALTWREKRPKDSPRDWQGDVRQRTLATGFTDDRAAVQAAELFVGRERRRTMSITSVDAAWKGKPASAGQLDYLAKLRVPVKAGLTMGEASALINQAKALKEARGGGGRRYPSR